MENLRDHPQIEWAEATGFPSWAQEVLGEFDDNDQPRMSSTNEIVLDAIPFGKENAIRRDDLAKIVHLSDRTIRQAIEEIRRTYIILNDQDGKGYYRSYDLKDLERSYRQERARALSILYRMQPIRTLLKGGGRI